MDKFFVVISLALLAIPLEMSCQPRYDLKKADFSTDRYDEFCPVLYQGELVFCSSQKNSFLVAYQNQQKSNLFNIFKVNLSDDRDHHRTKIFSKNLVTPFNDGPVSFSPDGKMVVFSRNIDSGRRARNVVDLNNNLGLFFAELEDGEWVNTSAFQYNNNTYSITTPSFSPDGQYLYFGSNMPGGFGGTDLYRSRLTNGNWSAPENLGKVINTSGNEVFPFISESGDLLFASDGHEGFGKKDIFLSRFSDSAWIHPLHLESPINSPEDDFGLYADGDLASGYFSSNRGASDDIYIFTTSIPQLFACSKILRNQYCFEFWDEIDHEIDTLPVVYVWEFSDGSKKTGLRVEHCLPGPGKYWARLNIIDNTTEETFYTQSSVDFEVLDHIQPFITSRDTGVVNEVLIFSGLDSNQPGFMIEKYIWDFGDKTYTTGPETDHQFKEPGTYSVSLGLEGYAEGDSAKEIRCVTKTVTILAE